MGSYLSNIRPRVLKNATILSVFHISSLSRDLYCLLFKNSPVTCTTKVTHQISEILPLQVVYAFQYTAKMTCKNERFTWMPQHVGLQCSTLPLSVSLHVPQAGTVAHFSDDCGAGWIIETNQSTSNEFTTQRFDFHIYLLHAVHVPKEITCLALSL